MIKSSINDVFLAIERERRYQEEKYGTVIDNPFSIYEWIGIMEKELEEAKVSFFDRPANPLMLQEILQVISVGVACLEQHGIVERWDEV